MIMLAYTEFKDHTTTQESPSIRRGIFSLYFGHVCRNVWNKSLYGAMTHPSAIIVKN